MDRLEGYNIKSTDWRTALRENSKKTRNVIIMFVAIYMVIGFLIDVYIYSPSPPQSSWQTPQTSPMGVYNYSDINSLLPSWESIEKTDLAPLKKTAYDLITFKQFPLATLGMLIVALISLLITFLFHKGLMLSGTKNREITPDTAQSIQERQLYNVIEELMVASGLKVMPKVYVIEADYMNAFASGYSEKSSLVAITKGLLEKLDRSELQAVMAHELSHVRHNDIRLTLTVTLLSNLILMIIDFMFRGLLYSQKRDNGLMFIILLGRFLLPILTLLLVMYLSRTREYMADAGSVQLTRENEPLARALIKIQQDTVENRENYQAQYEQTPNESVRRSAYFYDPQYAGIITLRSINDLFSTHPSLVNRLKALGITKKEIENL